MQFPSDFSNEKNELVVANVSKTYPLVQDPFNRYSMALIVLLCRHVSPSITIAIEDKSFISNLTDKMTCQDVLELLKDPQNYSAASETSIVLTTANYEKEKDGSTLHIHMLPSIKSLEFKVTLYYNAALHIQSRMADILEQLDIILHQPLSTPIYAISLVTPFARNLLPDPTCDLHWNEWPGSIIDYFKKNCEKSPTSPCIQQDGKIYSYSDILILTSTLSTYIHSKLPKGSVVSIFAHRNIELVISIVSILASHCTVNIIDPTYPVDRQITYLSVSNPKMVLHLNKSGSLHQKVTEWIASRNISILKDISIVSLTDMTSTPQIEKSTSLPTISIQPEDIATLSFTSGSTGTPKGVEGKHFSLTHFYPWMQSTFQLTNKDKFTMLSGIAHDPIQRDVFTPLFLGAQLCIPDTDTIQNGQLSQWIDKQQCTVTHLTPAMGQLVTTKAQLMPSLKCAFFVGDVLTKRDVVNLQRCALNCKVVNMYGTTETQRSVSYLLINSKHDSKQTSLNKNVMSAGCGMVDVQLLVGRKSLNSSEMTMCGIGELGELYVRSCGLAKGYLNNPDSSTKVFLPNPFTSQRDNVKDRCYRTGDLGRYLPNGHVECIGRQDDQIKIRGFRIELGEIDVHLSQHPLIKSNCTLVKRDEYEEHCLISYLVPSESSKLEESEFLSEIQSFLSEKLPHYSVPNRYMVLSHLPLTPNGKIDKLKLPFPKQMKSLSPIELKHKGYSEIEIQLHQIVHELGLVVKKQEDLFKCGLHSIMATKMILKCQSICLELTMAILYTYPTIEQLSAYFDMQKERDSIEFEDKVEIGGFDGDAQVQHYRQQIKSLDSVMDGLTGSDEVQTVFLTGSTGYLGCFILHELLELKYKLYCLIRSKSMEDAVIKLQRQMQSHGLLSSFVKNKERIKIVLGDLSEPQLGLSDADYKQITTVDSIIHNGALVHWMYPYQQLQKVNVDSTLECYKLCTIIKKKHLLFISSTSVLSNSTIVQPGDKISENDDLSQFKVSTGYGQSKWVCERMLQHCQVPVSIIRPGYIVGHGVTGITNSDDFLFRMIKGSQELKAAPIMDNKINMCTVDYVASITANVCHLKALGVFHCYQPYPFTFTDMFAMSSHYMDIKPIPYNEWKECLKNNINDALLPLLHFVMDDLPTSTKGYVLNDSNTQELIRQVQSKFGVLIENKKMQTCFHLMLGFLINKNYFNKQGNHSKAWKVYSSTPTFSLPELDLWKECELGLKRNNK